MKSEFIPYDQLNHINPIMIDYCRKGSVSGFYQQHYNDIMNGSANLNEIFRKINHRTALCDVLLDTNKKHTVSDKTIQNIDLLKSEKTYAVVTGQQMGLYSGPLYTIYKTIGAIKTAEYLKEIYPEYNFIPIFWLEHEDSDFQEINNIVILNKNNQNIDLFYKKNEKNEHNSPIFDEILSNDINSVNDEIFNQLVQTEFSENLSGKVKNIYKCGNKLSESFASLLMLLFSKFGLVLINPSEPDIKKLSKNIFVKSIDNSEEIHEKVIIQSKKLIQEGFFSQVDTRPSYLYYLDKGSIKNELNLRKLNKYRIKSPLKLEEKSIFLQEIDKNPEKFIPNVLLRPVVQDTILPTVAYIAGPGEIAYLAQTTPIYKFFNLAQPYIIPRPSVTIIERKIANLLEKYSLNVTGVMNHHDQIKNNLLKESLKDNILDTLENSRNQINYEMSLLREPLINSDPTLSGMLDTTIKKMNDVFSVLHKRTTEAEKRKNGELLNQAEKIISHVYPENDFQERKINILYYLNKYDFSFIDLLYENLQINTAQHQVLYL